MAGGVLARLRGGATSGDLPRVVSLQRWITRTCGQVDSHCHLASEGGAAVLGRPHLRRPYTDTHKRQACSTPVPLPVCNSPTLAR